MRHPLEIEVGDYLLDHRFEGRCVLPAAEALNVLAMVVHEYFSNWDMVCLTEARFPRFLIIPPEIHRLPVIVEIDHTPKGGISAGLMTSMRSRTGGISRNLEHARVEFSLANSSSISVPFLTDVGNPDGQGFTIPVVSIYPRLIPFGTAYRNIIGPVSLSPLGASASLFGGDQRKEDDLLGSPFPFDAALQMACIWGQCFTEHVPFPVGFEKRVIYQKTKKGGFYLGRIIPVAVEQNPFLFDALIIDSQGSICEEILGIQMQDVSQGRLHPPSWIKEL